MADPDPKPNAPARARTPAAKATAAEKPAARKPAAKRPDAKDRRIAELEARVADLESQLTEQARATNELVARAQERLYWLDRWGVDIERVMARPGAHRALGVLKAVRSAVRAVRKATRRVSRPAS